MCKNKVLVSKNNGYVAKCDTCHDFQIAFGTTVFGMKKSVFDTFLNHLYQLRREGDNYKVFDKKIYVDLQSSNAMMVLTPRELEDFIEIIETASIKNIVYTSMLFQN
jgi:hypothetical protein